MKNDDILVLTFNNLVEKFLPLYNYHKICGSIYHNAINNIADCNFPKHNMKLLEESCHQIITYFIFNIIGSHLTKNVSCILFL